jgi:hypothetical protein
MRAHHILRIACLALFVIVIACLANRAYTAGFVMVLIWLVESVIWMIVETRMALGKDCLLLKPDSDLVEVLRTAEQALTNAKWKSCPGEGSVNASITRLGMSISGVIMSVAIKSYDGSLELEVWMSKYKKNEQGFVKFTGQAIAAKTKVIDACRKYAIES